MAGIIGLALAGLAAFWVFGDAQKRGMNHILWAILTFFFLIIGLPVYLIMRKPLLEDGARKDEMV